MFKIQEQQGENYTNNCSNADIRMAIPIKYLAIYHYKYERATHHAEDHDIAELGEIYGELALRISMEGHGEEDYNYSQRHGSHHEIIDILPFIRIGKPRRQPCSHLSKNHEKEIDDWHARCLLLVEFIPALLCIGFISRCHIIRRLNVECILNKCEQIDHKQCLSHESHQKAAYGKKEYAVGLRTYVTECK